MTTFLRGRWPKKRLGLLALVALSGLGLPSCGDDEPAKQGTSSSGSTTGAPPPPRLSGNLRYEFVPYDVANDGLDYTKTEPRPIRGARVLLLNAADGAQIAETTADAEGHYSFDWEGAGSVKVWVYSETIDPPIVVEDNTASNARYVVESAEIQADMPATLDILATTGWTGAAYGKPRQSAPFSVLDAVYTAARRFMTETTPPPVFPKLKVNWSVDNRPESGNVASGQIDTSSWDGSEIYLLGKENIDTDEFDTHVLVHEWGHSFEDHISRSDSFGGSHGYGDVLDPRLAFSEGFCNALSGIILDPDSVYADASGPKQSGGFINDVEKNDTTQNAKPGWSSETTVENIVYDVYDPANEPFDDVALGLQGVYDVMVGEYKTTPALTTLFPFVSTLKTRNPSQTSAIDALVAHHSTGSTFGINTVTDDWGTSETHTQNEPGSIPVYIKAKPGDSFEVTLNGGLDSALLGANRFVRIAGTGATIKVSSTSQSDVDLYVFLRGKELDSSTTTSGNETVSFSTKTGEEYVINIVGYEGNAGPYIAKIGVSP